MTSKGMDVTVRIYQRYNVIPGNSTCITLLFQDNKDGDIKIAGLSAGDEYGIFGMDLGMGARTAQECEEKLESLAGHPDTRGKMTGKKSALDDFQVE